TSTVGLNLPCPACKSHIRLQIQECKSKSSIPPRLGQNMKYNLKHLNNPLNNFLDWFIADKIKNSEGNDDLIRRHRIIIFLLSSTVFMYFIALLYFTFFAGIAQRDFVVLMGLLIFYTGLLLLLKRTGAFTAVVLGQLLSGIVGMLSLTLTTGGINSP